MLYISPDNQYPRHIGDIQLEHPDYQKGDPLPEGWRPVEEVRKPVVEGDFVAYEGLPEEVDGVLSQVWETRPMTEEEIARRDAPKTGKAKLKKLGLTDAEIEALAKGLVR